MRRIVLLTMLLTAAAAAVAPAQRRTPDFASAFLPPGHWAIEAAARLHGTGLVEHGFDRARRPLTRREVARIFDRAVSRAEDARPDWAALARVYRDRFAEEFPATLAAIEGLVAPGPRLGDGSVSVGYERLEGDLLSGAGYENEVDWTGPVGRDDVSGLMAGADWSAELFPYVAVGVAPGRFSGDWGVAGGYVTGVWRDLGVWLGRRPIGYVPGAGGGIALNPSSAFDGGGLFLTDPVLLPWIFEKLGPTLFETFLSRVEHDGPIERPWIWGMRGTIEPHPRFGLGLSRVAMFGGEGKNSLSLKNLIYLAVGKHAGAGSGFDNQIVSLDAWFRPPIEAVPLVAYVEWGLEDSAGSWFDVPGFVFGLEVPALPDAASVAVGLERTSFGPHCCGNPIWYRHWQFLGGWTDGGIPLGHPLGGHGSEWLAWVRADLLQARLRLDARIFRRDRGAENLFAPDREGTSTGIGIAAALRPGERFDLLLEAFTEAGTADWTESALNLGARLLF